MGSCGARWVLMRVHLDYSALMDTFAPTHLLSCLLFSSFILFGACPRVQMRNLLWVLLRICSQTSFHFTPGEGRLEQGDGWLRGEVGGVGVFDMPNPDRYNILSI